MPVPSPIRVSKRRGMRGGFSLVEIALALAILVVAILPLILLLGVGLQASRESYEETVAAQIAHSIYEDLVIMSLSSETSIRTGDPSPFNTTALNFERYFDRSGIYLGDSLATIPEGMDVYFVARAEIQVSDSDALDQTYRHIDPDAIRTVRLRLGWPVDLTGSPAGPIRNEDHFVFILARGINLP